MPPLSEKKLEKQLAAAGKSLVQTPPLRDELLLPLLDHVEDLLSKVEQSPAKSMQYALSLVMKALVMEDLTKHSNVDVKVGVTSCISEITRITAPDSPYDNEKMKNVFQLIVSSFEKLSDICSISYDKRARILVTMAELRSCVIMLDLQCDQMIIEMFQHFLKAIREDHADVIFASMETIMTRVLEESEDISPELLAPILATLKRNNEAAMPITKKLAERVLQNVACKLRPYLRQAVKSLDTSLDDYSEVVSRVYGENTDTVGYSYKSISNDQPRADSNSQSDANSNIKTESDDRAAENPVSSKDKPEFVKSQQVLDNHEIPDTDWKAYVNLSDDDVGEGAGPSHLPAQGAVLSEQQDASDVPITLVQASGPLPTGIALPPPSRAQEREVPTSKAKGKRIASSDLSIDPSYKKFKSSSGGSSQKGFETRGASNDIFTLKLPKSLMELERDDCLTFLRSLPTTEDNNILSQNTDDQSEKAGAQLLVRFLAIYGRNLNREGSAATKDLRAELEAKDKEVLKVASDLKIATAEIAELKRRLEASERRLESLEQGQRNWISHYERREAAVREEGRTEGLVEGVEACRRRILLTSVGQTFLKELHEGLLDAYRQSTLCLADMEPHVTHFVETGFKSASSQAREKGFTEKLNINAALHGLAPSPAFKGDQSLPPSHPWWLPVMREAARKLAREDYVSPELPAAKEPFYDLFSSLGETSAHQPPISETGTPDLMVQDSKDAQAAALGHEGSGNEQSEDQT
ncbi:hypothetical protein ACS0TY_032618 [Phlomoides rotata]